MNEHCGFARDPLCIGPGWWPIGRQQGLALLWAFEIGKLQPLVPRTVAWNQAGPVAWNHELRGGGDRSEETDEQGDRQPWVRNDRYGSPPHSAHSQLLIIKKGAQ